jgi:AraC-like DNA-binding protein
MEQGNINAQVEELDAGTGVPEDAQSAATRAAIVRYHEAWCERDLDGLVAMLDPAVIYIDHLNARSIPFDELRAFLSAGMPQEKDDRQIYRDRLRVDGNTAFLRYRVQLCKTGGAIAIEAVEVFKVRDGLIFEVSEYASWSKPDDMSWQPAPVDRLGLSARQIQALGRDLDDFFVGQQAFLNPNLGLQDVSKATGYTRNQISFYLNEVDGSGFYRYVNRLRMDYLEARFSTGWVPARMEELGPACGFRSPSTFYRCFRETFGVSPGEYVEQFRQG